MNQFKLHIFVYRLTTNISRLIMRRILSYLLLLAASITAAISQTTVAINGNSYITAGDRQAKITKNGLENWSNSNDVISTYVKLHEKGKLIVGVNIKNDGKLSNVKATIDGKPFYINFKSAEYTTIPIGQVEIRDTGYIAITLQGVSRKGENFGQVASFVLNGPATAQGVVHCGTFEPYWASRGPSVHMKYPLPEDRKVKSFYNELTITKGNDPIGSYYMACGFGEGYFGMQVNSPTERRILFSVWSPFDTQDPREIPDSMQIQMLKQGEGVTIGEFGNEGSGGQSFLQYDWITGNTYKFLMRVEPDSKNNTIYTAYFFAPERGKWQLIAQFLRPKTDTHYTNAHSFLENFMPSQGYIAREVDFGNQWCETVDGEWIELTDAIFTFDATANAGVRKDYQGGVTQDEKFYLKNCGFFNQSTPYKSKFNRPSKGLKPTIDLP